MQENINAIINDKLLLISAVNPDVGFTVANAMSRNKYIYTLSDSAFVISSDYNKGGTWSGATENIRNNWVKTFVWDNKLIKGNIELIKNIDKLKQKDVALLTALSMKRVVKNTTNVQGEDLLYGTISANVLAIAGGTDIIRVHNVKENVLAAKMVDAVVRG